MVLFVLALTFVLNHGAGRIPVRYHATGSFALAADYPSTNARSVVGEHWASWNGADNKRGVLTTTPFRAPLAFKLFVAGGTARSNQHIELVGPGGATISLNTPVDAAEAYVPVIRFLPLTWYHRPITLRVTDDGGGIRGWVGVGDPSAASALDIAVIPIAWLAGKLWIYNWLAVLFLIALAICALFLPGTGQRWGRRDGAFVALTLLMFAWMRWPIDIANIPLNPDEAQTTAQAIKALHDFVPWHGFDPSTSGPLNSYILALPRIIGIVPTIVSTHVIGTLLIMFVAVALFATGRILWGSRIGACAVLAFVAVEAITGEYDFVHTSSELLPNAMFAGELWALALLYVRQAGSRAAVPAAIIGLLAGAMPLTKLQSTPTAVAVSVATLLILRFRPLDGIRAFAYGLIAVPLLILGTATVTGGLHDVYMSYIVANLGYVGASGSGFNAVAFMFDQSARFGAYFKTALIFIAVLCVWIAARRARATRRAYAPAALAFVLLLIAMYEATTPHRYFPHYLALITVPASLLVSAVAALAATERPSFLTQRRAEFALVAAAFLAFLAPPIVQGFIRPDNPLYQVVERATYDDPYAREMLRLAQRGDRVVVWGWAPILYDFTGTVMATRDCCSLFETGSGPLVGYYRDRYLSDFNAHRPALIVDAVVPTAFFLTDRKTQGIETFPELYAIVRKDYELRSEIDGFRFWTPRAPKTG